MKLRLALGLLFINAMSDIGHAQTIDKRQVVVTGSQDLSNGVFIPPVSGSDPTSASCTVANSFTTYTTKILRCLSGVWTVVGGSGGGASLPSTTAIIKGNGSGSGVAAVPNVDYQVIPLAGTLLTLYDFSKASGTSLPDQSGNGNNGVLVNTPGVVAGGLQFTAASSQSVTLPAGIAASTTTTMLCGDFTANYALSGSTSSSHHPLMGSFSMPGAGLQISMSDNLINANQGPVNGRLGTFTNSSIINESADSVPEFRPTCLGVVWNSSTPDDLYVDGKHVSLMYSTTGVLPTTGSAGTSHGSQFALMGNPNNSQFASGKLYVAAQWSSALTAAQMYQANEWARATMRANGVNLTTTNTSTVNNCTVVGDSRTAGATTNPFPYLLTPASDTFSTCYNFGVNSQSTDHMLAQTAGGPLSTYRPMAKRNVFISWGCTNNFFNKTTPDTPQQCVDYQYDLLRAAKLAGFQTMIMTEISGNRTQSGTGLTADQLKNTTNAIIRATWRGNVDMIADLGADPALGCDGCYANSNFQGDAVHPSQAGQNRIAVIASATIDAGASSSQIFSQRSVSANYTALFSDDLIRANTTSTSFTVTLPSAVAVTGKRLILKNIGTANTLTVAPAGSESIDTAPSITIPAGAATTIQSNGSTWDQVASSGTITSTAVTYAKTMPFTVDFTKVSTTNQSNFPVTVAGTYSTLATTANGGFVQNSNGYDITFNSNTNCGAGTKLNFELESYNATTGAVVFHVQVPVLSYTSNTIINACFGTTQISSNQSSTATWDSTFSAVYHMNSLTAESTAAAATGTLGGTTPPTQVAGKIGGAAHFVGAGYVSIPPSATALWPGGSSQRTVSIWAKQGTGGTVGDRFPFGYGANSPGVAGEFAFDLGDSGGGAFAAHFGDSLAANNYTFNTAYHQFVMRVSPGNTTVGSIETFVDGSVFGPSYTNVIGGSNTINTVNNTLIGVIGCQVVWNSTPGSCYAGDVDEIRVYNVAKSTGWILTEYNNINSPSTFYSVGSAVAPH